MDKSETIPEKATEPASKEGNAELPPIRYILFPRKGGWSTFPYPAIAALLAAEGEVFYVSRQERSEDMPPAIAVVTLPEAELLLQQSRTAAVITHPYWLMAAASLHPEICIVLLPEPAGDEAESPLWESCISRLVGVASLVGTSSEARYMKLAFQGMRAVWLGGENTAPAGTIPKNDLEFPLKDCELLFLHALRQIVAGAPDTITPLQCSMRADYYRQLRSKTGPHETISFLLAAYEYLLDDSRAAASLNEAFIHAIMSGRSDCIHSHYRFLSAIHAKAGEVEHALQVYGISAGHAQERHHYEQLCRWLEAGENQLVQAELLRINDDYGAALSILDALGGETARHWKFRIYQETGRVEDAMALVHAVDIQDGSSRRDYQVLSGTAMALRGERHGAVHQFLEAAMENEDALSRIVELELLDQAVQQLLGEVP
ncbi:hypothetical protein [Paenibacillus xylanilyticus]|uniref:Uncharacterized protein n=1 Tax=Paenibacillus xylanilyticus TaxID=248903 RepID=A0A7Y6EX68_9BACL|nr:hypothetical protein [Paenibacillus xylanilyticus]NUU77170.1 hypothetical protein [Paenibacillus xylanilyticus]